MNLKKIFILVLSLFVLAACSGEGSQSSNNNSSQSSGSIPKDAGKAIGEFPKVDIATAQLSPIYKQDKGDIPTYKMELKDGHFTPRVLVVPKNTKFRLEVFNTGTKPCEAESLSLRQERAIYMGDSRSMVIPPLNEGKYDIFDDFTNGFPAYIVAK